MVDVVINKAFVVCLMTTLVAASCTLIVVAVGLIISVLREGIK